MIELTCIGCPRGCHLLVDENNDYKVTGNNCEIGARYGKEELTNPKRSLTSTMICDNGFLCPVRTDKPISKDLIFEAMEIINKTTAKRPIKHHQVLIENILNCGVNIIASTEVK